VAEGQGLAKRQLQHLLRARRERDLSGGDLVPLPDDPRYLRAHLFDRDVERLEHSRRQALFLAEQAKKQVLGADVVVLQRPRLILGENDNLTSSFREALEQPP
jgi:hypothetical protein